MTRVTPPLASLRATRLPSTIGRLIVLLLCQLALAGGNRALAQFNGPSLAASSSVNRAITLTTDPAILYPEGRDIHLAAGDVLAIHIYGSTDYAPQVTVTLDGSVQLPLVGAVHIEGLTLHQTENVIAEHLIRAGMYRKPQVSVQLIESPNQVVILSGELRGIIPLRGSKRLFDVIAAGGGFPATASHIVTIHRVGQSEPIVVDLGTDPMTSEQANIPVFAGDTILTGRTGVVYMLGAFKNQGAIPLQQNSPLTLMQAATIAGGAGFEGKYNDLRLIRTIGLERKVVHLDIKRVLNGKDPDPVLQVDDIVMLPSSPMKAAIKSGGLGTALGLASVLLIAIQNR